MNLNNLSEEDLNGILHKRITVNDYIPLTPTEKQKTFLLDFNKEALYGGAAGGGKSVALLMAALMFVDEPEYRALILRRTYSQLVLPGALIDIAHELLSPKNAKWNDQKKQWTFPSGATLNFGFLDSERDKYRYQGAAFHFVGFDELTQFTESQYTYLFSRTRKAEGVQIPLRFRCTSNPGGIGHEWVRDRFISGSKDGRIFIPAGLDDNPHLDKEEYEKNLDELDPVTRKQLKEGDWDILPGGNFFKRERFEIVEDYPANAFCVRYWDLAASIKVGSDYTVGVKICEQGGVYWVIDVIREKLSPAGVEGLIRQTAELDGLHTEIFMEQEPGSSGLNTISHYIRNILKGFCFKGVRSTGSKIARAKPFAAAVDNGNVRLVRGLWNKEFIDECVIFPQKGFHDDQVDSAAGAFEQIKTGSFTQIFTEKIDRSSRITRGY